MLRTRDHFFCPLWIVKRDTDPETRKFEGYFSPSLRNVSDSNPVRPQPCLDRHINIVLVQQEYLGKNFHRKR
jgi:hypothetical protein